jgi:hypothetical protein
MRFSWAALAVLLVTTDAGAQDAPLEWIGRFSDGESTLHLAAGPAGVEGTLGIGAIATYAVTGAPGPHGLLVGTAATGGPTAFKALMIDDDTLLVALGSRTVRMTREGVPPQAPLARPPLPPVGLAPARDAREAVDRALDWLLRHQDVDGSWSVDAWTAHCPARDGCAPAKREAGDRRYREGVTALATLALLRGGLTDHVDRRRAVERAVQFLRVRQGPDGAVGFDPGFGESIHSQAAATHALALATGVLDDAGARAAAVDAVGFCVQAQNPGMGWKYGIRSGRNDTSVTASMAEALHAARAARIDVPGPVFEGVTAWVLRATDSEGNTGYETPGGGSSFLGPNDGKFDVVPVMTAAGVVARRCADPRADVSKGTALVFAAKPAWEPRKLHFYYWYYGTRALALRGGAEWKTWRTALTEALVPNQRRGGCASGSWEAIDEWGLAGGRVYATAINALTLTLARP